MNIDEMKTVFGSIKLIACHCRTSEKPVTPYDVLEALVQKQIINSNDSTILKSFFDSDNSKF